MFRSKQNQNVRNWKCDENKWNDWLEIEPRIIYLTDLIYNYRQSKRFISSTHNSISAFTSMCRQFMQCVAV